MLTQTRLAWIGLIIAISLGLSIEALKTTHAAQDGSSWRSRIFGMDSSDSDDGVEIEHRSAKAGRARSRLLKGRLAGLSENSAIIAAPVAAAVPAPPVPNLTPLKLTQSEEAKKKAAEAAKKKKKKKKKKKTDEAVAENSPQAPAHDEEKPKSDQSSGATGGGGSVSQTQSPNFSIPGSQITENPETLEQWLAYILREPNYDHTLKLIKDHESHIVDNDVFYEVITQMLTDSRAKMHEYAIYALGSSPSLKSFILLGMANLNEPEGSQLRAMSRLYIQAYAKLDNLKYLANVISSGDGGGSAYEALHLIQIAVTDYKPKAAPPATGPTTSSLAISRQFTSLVPVLSRVSQISTDATLRTEAARTLRLVQTVVGTPIPATAPVATVTNR